MFAPLFFFADTPKWQKNGHKNTQCDGIVWNAGENVVAGSNLKFWDSVLLFHFIIIIFLFFFCFVFSFWLIRAFYPSFSHLRAHKKIVFSL